LNPLGIHLAFLAALAVLFRTSGEDPATA